MESEQLREIVKENNQLEEKLTKRNQQYIFDLKKSLEAANLSEEEKVKALHDILPTLVSEQKVEKQPDNYLELSLKELKQLSTNQLKQR